MTKNATAETKPRKTAEPPIAELKAALEALLYVTPEPATLSQLCEALGAKRKDWVEEALDLLTQEMQSAGRGFEIEKSGGGYRLVTKPEYDSYVRTLLKAGATRRLSRAALETLAVVAYRQPVTLPEIEDIRGLDSSGVMKSLLDKHLVKIAGRKEVVGKPFLYRTAKEFLVYFGLDSLDDLPSIEEFQEAFGSEPQAPLLFQKPESLHEGGVNVGGETVEADSESRQDVKETESEVEPDLDEDPED